MTHFYKFRSPQSETVGFTADPSGLALPPEQRPWISDGEVDTERWNLPMIDQRVVTLGVSENGFYTWDNGHAGPPKATIESDRVEGTVVLDHADNEVGKIRRLIIHKASGRVLYVDVTFGGFLGMGVEHRTVPWEKLTYDSAVGAYRTEITAAQVIGAPQFGDEEWIDVSADEREQRLRTYWELPPH